MPKQQPFCGGLCGSGPRYLWIYSTVVLLVFGFFKELKPSEAFLNPYLTSEPPEGKNFSQSAVNDDVYPFWTYSYLVSLFFVFIFTDFMRYNPVILVESFSYVLTRILLIWGTSLLSMQLMQVVYGVATATEVGYFTYLYAVVPQQYHVLVTGPIRAAVLAGRAVSSFAGQGLYSTGVLNYYGLNYFSLVSVCIAACVSLLLPWYFSCPCVKKSSDEQLTLNSSINDREKNMSISSSTLVQAFVAKLRSQYKDLVKFYFTPSLLKWSIWWAVAMCGMLQVGNYVQSLWSDILLESNPDTSSRRRHELNGIVEGSTDLLAAFAALLASVLKVNWVVWGELTMGVFSLVQSFLLFFAAHTSLVWVAYICHIVYRSSYSFMITIASSQLAISQTHESYGLIFGINTFMALSLQTILTAVVNTQLGLSSRLQFIVYGFYYYGLTVIFVFAGVYKIGYTGLIKSFKSCWRKSNDESTIHDGVGKSMVLNVTEDKSAKGKSSDGREDDKLLVS